jgi:hypothetical protein
MGSIGLLIVVTFTHPLLIFPFAYLHVFFYFNNILHRKLIITSFVSYWLMLVLKVLFFATPYDRSSMSGLKNFQSHFPNYFDTISFKHFWQYLLNDYYMLLGLFILTFSFLVYSKQWLNLVLMLIATFGYVTLVNVSYINGAEQFYLENQYLLLIIFCAVPFVYLFYPVLETKHWNYLLFVLLVVSFTYRVFNVSHLYNSRLNWIRTITQTMAKSNNSKVILLKEDLPMNYLQLTWGSGYESWLVSTIEQSNSQLYIIEENKNQFDYLVNNSKEMVTLFGVFEISQLDRRYFKPDTNQSYQKMSAFVLLTNR